MGKTKRFFSIAILGIALFSSFTALGQKALAQDTDPNDDRSILDREEYDGEHPWYMVAPSRWAVSLRSAFHAFPGSSAVGGSHQLTAEYIFPFQSAGLFSFGGHVGLLPLNADNSPGLTPNFYLNTTGGPQLRYQLRISPSQWFVPTVAVEWDYIRLKSTLVGYDHVSTTTLGFSFGAYFDLGWIDKLTAANAYNSIGLTKTYLTAEMHPIDATPTPFILSGTFWYLGFRVEFD